MWSERMDQGRKVWLSDDRCVDGDIQSPAEHREPSATSRLNPPKAKEVKWVETPKAMHEAGPSVNQR